MLERELQRLFGFQTFKEGQKEIIEALMAGNDVFAMLPTGRGKSLCYQLPAFFSERINGCCFTTTFSYGGSSSTIKKKQVENKL